jgi:nucleoside-diphosphate-sugar epimerase
VAQGKETLDGSLVLVTGAGGFVGTYLIEALQQAGASCKALVRSEASREKLADRFDGLTFHEGDLTDAETLGGIANEVDYVVHLAAEGHVSAVSEEAFRRFTEVNVRGTERLLEACAGGSVKRFVHFSSTAAMGLIRNTRTTEADEPQPRTPYQRSKLASEQAALDTGRRLDVPVVVLRPCMIYGPGGHGTFEQMCRWMARGRFPKVGRGKNLTPMVHVRDVVQATLKALLRGAPYETYLVTSARSLPLDEFRSLVIQAYGVNPFYPYVPSWAMYALAYASELFGRLTSTPPKVTVRNVASTLWDREFSIDKARSDLGYEPAVSFEEGIAETVAWLQEIQEH